MMAAPITDLDTIEQAVRAADPAALVDLDPQGRTVRVAASLDAAQLISILDQAGHPVTQDQVTQVPSVCCGGCGG